MSSRSEAAAGRRGRSLPTNPTSSTRKSGLAEALAAAARRVLEDPDAWLNAAINPTEAEETLYHLRSVLEDGDPEAVRRGEHAAQLSLQRRLLDRLRRELILRAERVGESALLTLLRRIEILQDRLEPAPHQTLPAALLGVNSRDLVVEMAHDLRSPLTSVMFLADTLRKGQSGEINDTQRQQVGIIYSASLNLVSVASDLIDLAREGHFVSGKEDPEAFSLGETFESVRAIIAPMAHEKRLDLQFYTPDRDVRVGNPARLHRVLLNLASNAIKFTETGRVEAVAVERGPSRIEFSVRDTGQGMPEDAISTLFEPFRRSESESGFQFSGTGLGLSICRRLVEVMGGELQVESRLGYGTRFYFELELPRVRG